MPLRQVRTLINHKMSAGLHQITWNGKDDFEKESTTKHVYISVMYTKSKIK